MRQIKFVLAFIFGIAIISATFPGIPHQFYGNVFDSQGNLISNGNLESFILGEKVGETIITNGRYGYEPIFFIEDPNQEFRNKNITFYVNGILSGSYIYENGETTKLDLFLGARVSYCGDDMLNSGEQCDDGNTVSGDGCSAICKVEGEISCSPGQRMGDVNGDGVISKLDAQIATSIIFEGVPMPGNTCCIDVDQSNRFDISDAVFIVNIYHDLAESPGVCPLTSSCGNGVIESGEQCDDGINNGKSCNNDRRDCNYCSNSCKIIEREEDDNDNDNDNDNRRLELSSFCEPNWECGTWADCENGVMKRICEDENNCGSSLSKPQEVKSCQIDLTRKAVLSQNEVPWFALFIGALLLIMILFLIFNINNFKKE